MIVIGPAFFAGLLSARPIGSRVVSVRGRYTPTGAVKHAYCASLVYHLSRLGCLCDPGILHISERGRSSSQEAMFAPLWMKVKLPSIRAPLDGSPPTEDKRLAKTELTWDNFRDVICILQLRLRSTGDPYPRSGIGGRDKKRSMIKTSN